MKFHKIVIIFLAFSVTMHSFASEVDVEFLADKLLEPQTHPTNQFSRAFRADRSLTDIQAIDIQNQFNLLSVEIKHKVLKSVRKKLNGNYLHLSKLSSNSDELVIDRVYDLAEADGNYINDVSDVKLKEYFNQASQDLGYRSSNVFGCKIYNYPKHIHYREFPVDDYYSYYLTVDSIERVVNDPDEFACDYELSYNGSKKYIWGRNLAARNLLNSRWGFGGTLSKRTVNGKDKVIIGYLRAKANGFVAYYLQKNIVIWD